MLLVVRNDVAHLQPTQPEFINLDPSAFTMLMSTHTLSAACCLLPAACSCYCLSL